MDVEAKKAKGQGYVNWAKKHNLKNMSKALMLYEEHEFSSPEELDAACNATNQERSDALAALKDVESAICDKKELQRHVLRYFKTKQLRDGLKACMQFLIDAGNFAQQVAGPAMAVSIGAALSAPQLVLYSLIAVGMAANKLGGAGGPLAVYFITIVASECGKIVSKETKVDILVTPAVTILVGVGLSVLCAPAIGAAASSVG